MNAVAYLETGVLHCEDNLHALARFPSACVDLVYLDPPFFSNRTYEVIWGDEAEVRSFEDRWEGGINVYLEWMEVRLRHLHRVLKPTGSLYLHCDQAAGHYLKVLLDEIFGTHNFRNEIIWRRTGSNSARKRYGPIHQNIFYYGKSSKAPYYPQFRPYSKRYVAERFRASDERGPYHDVSLTGPGRRSGDSGLAWRGYDPSRVARHWQPSSYVYKKYAEITGQDLAQFPLLERLDSLDQVGMLHWTREGVPRYKHYLADAPGVALQDIWAFQPGSEGVVSGAGAGGIDEDVKWLGRSHAERVGYPTQKPEGVLERIVRSSTLKGDIVLDPFCGCGTTVAVAQRLGRQWIGIDISPQAVEIVKLRLNKQGGSPVVHGLPTSVDDLRLLGHFEFQNWVIQRVLGNPSARNTGDMGVDGYSFFELLPIQVKQRDKVGRPDIDSFRTAVEREGKHKGFFVAFSFTKGAVEEVARLRRENNVEVALVTAEDLVRVGDLIDSADRDGRPPDLSAITPDLMGLFSALQQSVKDRPFYPPPSDAAKPTVEALLRSARARASSQGRLPLDGGSSHGTGRPITN
jgi:DNA modification methylase